MPTTDQARTSTSPARSEDAGRLDPPAWPTRDLERRSNRAESMPRPTPAEATTAGEDHTPATHPIGVAATATPADVSTSTSMEGAMAPTGTSPTTTAPAAPVTPAMTARKAFLADLTRAMRIAAEEQREEVLGRFRAEAASCVTSMQGKTADAGTLARERCDGDVATLEEWCAEELRRIRRETDESIAERRASLEAELTTHGERLTTGVARVETTVSGFESQMSKFFQRLLAEEDPTKFAGLAERMPEPPAFGDWSPTGPDEPELSAMVEMTDAPMADTAMATMGDAMDMDALEADALAAAEAEAAAGLADGSQDAMPASEATTSVPVSTTDGSSTTRAVVCALGLVSVASVSSFKRVLARSEGIHTVNVSSGPQGEFFFNLTCDPEVDLGAIVAGLPGFDIEMRSVAEGRVDVVAHERDQN